MLQKSGRLVLWEAMFILELHSAETQGGVLFWQIYTFYILLKWQMKRTIMKSSSSL